MGYTSILPEPAASLQILATLLHITTERKCKIHLSRFNYLHLSFPSNSSAIIQANNSLPQAAEFMDSYTGKSHTKVSFVLQITEMPFPLAL